VSEYEALRIEIERMQQETGTDAER
jgi:hypothetical protein